MTIDYNLENEVAPTILRKPRIREEDGGNRLLFECQLISNPIPTVKWYKENRQITDYDRRISMHLKELLPNRYLATLDINDVVGPDAGIYRIHAVNMLGDVSASLSLNFTPSGQPHEEQIDGAAPTFSKKPSIKQEDDGRILIFECKIQADPKPNVSWYHNNTLVEPKGRYKVTTVKETGTSYIATMEITDVAVEDAGKYRVIAKNELGESNASISLNFDSDDTNIPAGEAKPTFTEKPVIKQLDGKIIFECRLVANPKPQIKWFHKNNLVKEDSRHKYNLTSDKHNHFATLEITGIVENESGQYKLVASNSHGEDEATINLNFDQGKPNIPDGKPPRFPKKPTISQVKGSLLLQCYLEANPFPEIAWFHGSTKVQNSTRHKISDQSVGKDAYLLQLEIKNPVNEDGGTYRCNACNGLGESNANIALNFQGNDAENDSENAPKFITKPKIIPKDDGNLILMECKVKSAEKITVTWFKGSTVVRETSKIKQVVKSEGKDEYLVYLEIKSPTAAEGGQYKCNVKNSKGEINANLTLNIEGDDEEDDSGEPPTFVEKPRIIAENDGKLIKMDCKIRSVTKPTITWTCDGEKIVEGGRIQKILKEESSSVYHMKLELRNPILTDAGMYKCNVKNEHGECNANLKLNIELAPVIKEKPKIIKRQKSVIIEVIVESGAPPNVSWMKETTMIKEDSRRTVYVKEKKKGEFIVGLEINPPEMSDKGSYKVIAKNEKGECQSLSVRVDDIEEDKKKDEEKKKVEEKKKEEEKKEEEKKEEEKKIDKKPSVKKPSVKEPAANEPESKVPAKRPSVASKIEPPLFIYQLKSLTIDEGGNAKFSCQWESKEKVTSIRWFSEKKEIKQSSMYSIINKETTAELIINNCVHESTGEYSISVTNKGGTSESSALLTVKAKVEKVGIDRKKRQSVLQQKDTIEEEKKKKSIDEGKQVKKSSIPQINEPEEEKKISKGVPKIQRPSEKTSDSSRKSVPEIQEPTEKAPENQPRGGRRGSFFDVNQVGQRRGSFNPSDRRDSKTEFDPTDKSSTPLKASPNDLPARIFNYQENQQCTEGKTAYIQFDVEGNPVPTLRFFKDGQEIYASGRYTLVTDGSSNTVYFCVKKSKPNDEGRYKVIAENRLGQSEAEIGLFIGGEEGVDFRAMLKRGRISKWAKKDEDPDWGNLKAVEDERRASLKEMQKPQVFSKPLQNQRCKEGRDKKVRFDCVFSRIGVKAKWYKNRVELFPGKRYQMTTQGDLQVLEIIGPIVADEGKYMCQCLDTKTEALLEVDPPDPVYKFTKKLNRDSKGYVGMETILECVCNSSKAPVKWFRGDEKLENGPKYLIESETNGRKILRILNSTEADSGTYSCVISTNQETTTTKVNVVEPSYKFMRVLRSMRINETEKILLECELDDGSAEVVWYKNGKEITKDKHVDIQKDGKKRRLIIKKAKCDDEAKYLCKAKGDETECEVLVEPLNRFKKKLKDVRTFENKKIVLDVELTDNRAQLKWLRNGKEIRPGTEGVTFKFHDDKHMLIIENCSVQDAGEYTAMINENIKSMCKVIVDENERPPSIKLDQNDFVGHEDKPFNIEIPYTVPGTRLSDVTAKLLKNGVPVNPKDIDIQVKQDKVVISFKKPQRNQSGNFKFQLTNGTGSSDLIPINVNILGKPSSPEGPLVASDVKETGLKLSWKPPADDGGAGNLIYDVEKLDVQTGRWVKVGETRDTNFEITGLTKGKKYKFRVKAKNKEGESEPLETDGDIIAKNPYDVPAKISSISVKDYDFSHVDLEWTIPDDGGAAIESFVVEYREKYSPDWKKGVEVGPKQTTGRVSDLKDGKTYEFRVKAKNKAGEGEPSDPTAPVLVKHKNLKPFLTGDGLKNLVVKKGAIIKYEIKFRGEPAPEVTWILNNQEIKPSSKVSIESTANSTIIIVKNAVRADSGTYKLVLSNASGKCESVADVIVLDKPSPPEGPLVLEEVRAQHVKIKWRKPKDDGGQKLKGYVIKKMDLDTGKWVPVAEVSADVTDFKIEGLTKNKKYKFRVCAVNKDGESEPLDSDYAVEAKNPFEAPSKITSVEIKDYDVSFVDLKWEAPKSEAPVENYIVEMKSKSGNWEQVTQTNGPSTEIRVDGLTENDVVQFRVIAENEWGQSEPSDPTGAHTVKYKNLKPSIDRTYLTDKVVKVGQSVKYEAKVRGEPCPTVVWKLGDKELKDDENIKITNKDYHTVIEIKDIQRLHNGALKCFATNINGQDVATINLTVLGKPSRPNNLEVSDIHKTGCKLNWDKCPDDGGCDVTYEVMKLNEETGRWTKCGDCKGTEFEVKGLSPGKKYKFRVIAVNKEGESEPLETDHSIVAKSPYDPPSKVKNVEIKDYDVSHVDLKWEEPKSQAPILNYFIEMKSKAGDWVQVGQTDGPATEFKVKNLIENDVVQFRVIAENDGGLSEPSDPTSAHTVKHKNLKPSIDRTYLVDKNLKVGQSAKFEAKVKGEPCPTVVWMLGDKELKDDENVKITNTDYHTIIEFKNVQRAHNGELKCVATNINGIDTAVINFEVQGKPSKPENLVVSDVHDTGCKLSWDKSPDDGGSDVIYEVMKLNEETGRWTRCGQTDSTDFEVKGLIPGKKFKFRVVAVNKTGDSEPLETEHSIIAKNPYDVPSKVKNVAIKDYDFDHVDLEWSNPNDGGAPLESFVIEYKEKFSGNWKKALEVPAGNTNARVPNLKEGQSYEFRVKAKNKAGEGEPSDPTDSIVIKHKNLKPWIDRTYLVDKTVKVGQTIKLEAVVKGEPCPKVVWTFGDKELTDNEHVRITNSEYFTEIEIKDIQRFHNGPLKCTATNINGSDSVTVQLTVQDVPSKPQDLVVSDVTAETCKLSWKPSPDDGGCKTDHYEISKLENGRWIKCGNSNGCEFEVKTLIPGNEYKFRVVAVNKIGDSEPLDTDHAVVAKDLYTLPGKPGKPEITSYDNESVSLNWEPGPSNGTNITGYIVEMKTKYGSDWVQCGKSIGANPEANITGLKEGAEVQFRVKAVNKAGVGKPSEPTGMHLVKHSSLKPHIDRTNLVNVTIKEGKSWHVDANVTGEPAPKVEWFFGNSDVSLITDAFYNIRNRDYHTDFTLDNAQRKHRGEYKVTATNSSGFDSVTIVLDVIGKPGAPEGPLFINEVTGDGCKLRWDKPVDDGGTPISHYEVFALDCETNLWTKCGNAPSENFKVTGLTTNKEYKFKVTAVNSEGSSEPLESMHSIVAKNQFDVPSKPSKPIIKDFDKNYADLKWLPPFDDKNSKILGYIIYKKEKNSSNWRKAAEIQGDVCEGRVPDLVENSEYEFRVVALNAAGQSPPSDSSELFTARSKNVPPKISGSTAELFLTVGDLLSLDFRLYGSPNPTVNWTFNNIPIKNDENYNIDSNQDRTVLRVRSVKREDSGLYRLQAKNSNGVDELTIKVNVIEPPSPPGVPDVTEVGGDFVNLQWEKPKSDGGSRILGYWAEKREKGMEAWQRINSLVCHALQVNAPHLIEDREYEFRIFAFNKAGMSKPSQASKMIKIKDPQASKPPEFITPLRNVFAIENKSCEFSCTVANAADVTWYKGSRELSEGGKYTMLQEGEMYTLSIRDVFGEDQDEYSIRATNKAGSRSSRADLKIKSAPKLNVPPRFRDLAFFERGENCVIKIPFTGFPKPSIKWSKEGEEIEVGDHFEMEVKERHAVLVIKDASRLDDGPYRIFAENELGSDSAIINVKISDRPDPPRLPMVEVIGDTFVNLSWKAPIWNGGSAITNYVILKRSTNMDTWIRCANTRYLLHQVTGLSPERDYEFCVCAENIYGRSDPSEITNKITTRPSESDKQKKKHWNFDADGKKVRGIDDGDTKDYDRLVTPINKIPAIPVDIKTSSVYDQYEILEEIGTGIYGVVHRCRDKRTGHFFMAKFIPATHPFEKSVIRKEIDLMNQLHHNNILRLHDAFEDEDEMIMIYEFVSGEELFERAAKEDYHMSEEQVVNYMRQICNAVKFMHERNIIHLDLKPECFLLNSSKTDEVKLVDFGLASKLDPHEMVKISTGTAEFAAPEIIDKQSVGFYTDMWAVGVLAFTLLCGKSPFASSNLSETLNRIRNGTWSFDSHSVFQNISDEGKDFITKLLQVKKDKRMTAHECLLHSWLKQDQGKASKAKISSSNYIAVRDAMRGRYSNYWNRVRVPVGHTSNYSALRKLRDELKFLHDVCIDRRELAPRFVVRPVSSFTYEGQAAKFYCRVLSPAAPAIISWNRDNNELKQSVKYMKRYAGTEFTFIINRAKTSDRGEYIIRAENHYGWREEPVFLNVHPKPTQMPSVEPLPEPRRSRRGPRPPVWLNEPPSAPTFTFQLRPRVIQVGIGVKLLGCIKSNPSCDVIWRKDGRVLSKSEYTQTNKDGVVTLEITSCSLDDAGKYTCIAENMLGTSESTCVVIVDKKF